MSSLTYKKILLKYSGEAVAGTADQGIDPKVLHFMSQEIKNQQLFIPEPLNQRGIHCRFGSSSVMAEAHFDNSRNMGYIFFDFVGATSIYCRLFVFYDDLAQNENRLSRNDRT